MEIHAIFVLKHTGEAQYYRIFSKQFKDLEVYLISALFSAFFSFTKEVLSEEPSELEMGNYRFVFRKDKDYIFAILADITVSTVYIDSCLEKITEVFFIGFDRWDPDEVIHDEKFDSVVDEVIYGGVNILKKIDFYKKIEAYFKDKIRKREIIGAGLFTTLGEIVYSSLPENVLVGALKELEIKFRSGLSSLPSQFYTFENGQKVFSKLISHDFIIVLLFEKKVSLGMAELIITKTAKEIENDL